MVGQDAACALDMNDDLWCWGRTISGVLHEEPVLVPRPPGTIRKLHAGYGALSVLFEDGYLWAPPDWSTTRTVSYGLETSDVTVSRSHECRLSSTRAVWCSAPESDHLTSTSSGDILVALAAGDGFTCALAAGGSVSCWGVDPSGQLANDSLDEGGTYGRVEGLPAAVDLSAGSAHACALSEDGEIWCWGVVPGFGEQLEPLHIPGTGGEPTGISPLFGVPPTSVGQFAEAALVRGTTLCACSEVPTPDLANCAREEGARFNLRCLHSLELDEATTAAMSCMTDRLNEDAACWVQCGNTLDCSRPTECPVAPEPFLPNSCSDYGYSCSDADIVRAAPVLCDGKNDCGDGSDEANCAPL